MGSTPFRKTSRFQFAWKCSINQAIVGNDRVYFVRVDGDKITFKSPGVVVPLTGKTSVVEFEMTKAQ
jgi:hypothetical protein